MQYGSLVSSLRYGPRFNESRTYAKPRSELEVNGIGPFSLWGSRLDSGACCQTEVQERSALLVKVKDERRRKFYD